jgi:cytochrome c oxidase assembly factor CtaG
MRDPFAFHIHPVTIAVIVAAVALYIGAARGKFRPTKKQRWAFAASMVGLLIAGSWPLEDLAAHWSLTALIVQRLLLILVVAPMLLISLPPTLAASMTRPRFIDATLAWVSKPQVAVVIFTAVGVGTLVTPAVAAQSSSAAARTGLDALLLLSGMVLWSPVMITLPGTSRPSPLARAVYLFVQSVIPGFPSIIFVFSHHPFYPAFHDVHHALGISPLVDQQLAGVIAKVATIPVLWSAAWVELSKAHLADREGRDTETLTWAEVQRQLERAERAERSAHRQTPTDVGDRPNGQPPTT